MILQALCLFNLNSTQDLILSDVNNCKLQTFLWRHQEL